MAVNKIVYGNNSLLDLSSDTLTSADQLLEGIIAHAKDGNIITGTLAGIKHNSLYTVAEGTFTVAEKITIDNNNRFIFEHNSGFVPLLFTIKSSSTTKQNDLVYIYGRIDHITMNMIIILLRLSQQYGRHAYYTRILKSQLKWVL